MIMTRATYFIIISLATFLSLLIISIIDTEK